MPDDLKALEDYRVMAVHELKLARERLEYWTQGLLDRMEPLRGTSQWTEELEAHYQDLKKALNS